MVQGGVEMAAAVAALGWVAAAREMAVLATAAVGLAKVGVGMGAVGCKQVETPAVISSFDA